MRKKKIIKKTLSSNEEFTRTNLHPALKEKREKMDENQLDEIRVQNYCRRLYMRR